MTAYRPRTDWLSLGEGFHDVVTPARFPTHLLRWWNQRALAEVGLDSVDPVLHFGRFEPLPDNLPEPLALRYHGHQFQHYNPDLGDGRGFLFAQLEDEQGRLLDIGTKGSGTTPWSRGGDGRLTLQGGVREVLAAELLEARGVGTCRILSLVETGEELWRHDEPSPARGCVMARLNWSHVRFGSFQRLRYFNDTAGMDALLHYCQRLVPHEGPVDFLAEVARRKAETVAGWTVAGFVHGVLNTDNMNVTGESFDYGPWRWLPEADPAFTAAYFDHGRLYAWGRQVEAVGWNLARLAEALSELAPRKELLAALEGYGSAYQEAIVRRFAARLGLKTGSVELVREVGGFLRESRVPFDAFFHDCFGADFIGEHAAYAHPGFAAARAAIEACEPLGRPRPTRVSLLNEEVQAIWARIAEDDDWGPFNAKVEAIRASG